MSTKIVVSSENEGPQREFEFMDCYGSTPSIISQHEIVIKNLDQCRNMPDYISVKTEDETSTTFDSSNTQTPVKKEKPKPPVRNSNSSIKPEFSKDKDIPDVSMKVYDFVMSKDKTIPKSLSLEEHLKIRRNVYWIGGFVFASLVIVIIIVVVLCTVNTSPKWV